MIAHLERTAQQKKPRVNAKNISLFQNLATEKTYNNLNVLLREANEHHNEWRSELQIR